MQIVTHVHQPQSKHNSSITNSDRLIIGGVIYFEDYIKEKHEKLHKV